MSKLETISICIWETVLPFDVEKYFAIWIPYHVVCLNTCTTKISKWQKKSSTNNKKKLDLQMDSTFDIKEETASELSGNSYVLCPLKHVVSNKICQNCTLCKFSLRLWVFYSFAQVHSTVQLFRRRLFYARFFCQLRHHPKSLYVSPAMSHFHGTEYEIWAAFTRCTSLRDLCRMTSAHTSAPSRAHT